jgi:hypothetical protein
MTARRRRSPRPRRRRPDGRRQRKTLLTLTAIYEPDVGGWVRGRLVELPGAITAAPTMKGARSMIRDALVEYLASFDPPPAAPRIEVEELELQIVLRGENTVTLDEEGQARFAAGIYKSALVFDAATNGEDGLRAPT